MNGLKIKEVVQADLGFIRRELIENPAVFIKDLFESLRRIKDKPFSAYKVDLSLSYLKQVYGNAFPSVKHGGLRTTKSKKSVNSVQIEPPEQVVLSSPWSKSVPLVDKAILINLFKEIRLRGKVPSFVKLITLRSELSSRAIEKRIYVGDFIANCTEDNRSIALFRSNKISHTKFLAEIKKKEKSENETQKNKFD